MLVLIFELFNVVTLIITNWIPYNNKNNDDKRKRIIIIIIILTGAAASYAVGKINGGWEKYGELIMAMVAIGQGVVLSFFAETESLMSSYICYIVFCCSYQTMLTISR